MICKVYGVQDPCPPLSCLSNSLYVRLGDLKSELQQTITDQAEVIKNQTEVIADQADIITQLRDQLNSQVMLRVLLNNHVCKVTSYECRILREKSDPTSTFPPIFLVLDHLSKICMILF